MKCLGKRGMSPLIATVLLMAFAVALGGMIMNIGPGSGEHGVDCSAVSVNVLTFCHDDSAIHLHARNTGDGVVDHLTMKILHPETEEFSVDLKESLLRKGESVTSKVPFLVDEETSVSLYASLGEGDDGAMCPLPIVTKKPLPEC